jgi:hypothetical protein
MVMLPAAEAMFPLTKREAVNKTTNDTLFKLSFFTSFSPLNVFGSIFIAIALNSFFTSLKHILIQ